MPEGIVRVPRSPTYADIKQVVHALEGEPAKRVDMMNAIFDAAGLPHGPVDWSAASDRNRGPATL
jgi:hypothetical protein